jgi:hypothetical protein
MNGLLLGFRHGRGTYVIDGEVQAFAGGAADDFFRSSVSLSGRTALVGTMNDNSVRGKAYTGSISSVTKLDEGSDSRTISGISFVSQDDWIIGQVTDYMPGAVSPPKTPPTSS